MCCWKVHALSLSYALLVFSQCYKIANGKDNDARKTYVVRYRNGDDSTIPVTVVLDYKKQAEYVINMNTRTPTKSVTFYDFKQKSIAYKDMRNKECFIGKLTNETLQTENEILQRLQSPLDLNPLPLKLDSTRSSLNPTEVRNFAGQKIAMFCRKMAAWLLQEPPNFRRSRRQAVQRIEKTFSHHGQEKHEYSRYGHESFRVDYHPSQETHAQTQSSRAAAIEQETSHPGNLDGLSKTHTSRPDIGQASQNLGIYHRQQRRRYSYQQEQYPAGPNAINETNTNRVPNAYYHEDPRREGRFSRPIRHDNNIDEQSPNSSSTELRQQGIRHRVNASTNVLTHGAQESNFGKQQSNVPVPPPSGYNSPLSYRNGPNRIHSIAVPSRRQNALDSLSEKPSRNIEVNQERNGRQQLPRRVVPSYRNIRNITTTLRNSEREIENIAPFNLTGEERRIDSDVVLHNTNRKIYDPDAIPTNERIVAASRVRTSNSLIPVSGSSSPYPKYFSVYNNHRADIPSEEYGVPDSRRNGTQRTSTLPRPVSSSTPKRGRHHNVLQLFTPDEIVIDVGKIPKKSEFPLHGGMRTPSYPNAGPNIRSRNFSQSTGRVWRGRLPPVRLNQPNGFQNNRVPYGRRRKIIPVSMTAVQQRQPFPRFKAALPPGVSLYPRHPNAPYADYADPSVHRPSVSFTNTVQPPQHRQRHFRKKQRTPSSAVSCCEPGNAHCCSQQQSKSPQYQRSSYQRSCCASMKRAAAVTRTRQQRRLELSNKDSRQGQRRNLNEPRTMSPEEMCDRKKMCRTLYQSAQAVKVCRQPDVPGC